MISKTARVVFFSLGVLIGLSAGSFVSFHLADLLEWQIPLLQALGIVLLSGLLGGVIGYLMVPLIVSGFKAFSQWFEARLQTTPLSDILAGVVGLVLGLIIANLLRPAMATFPYLGEYVPTVGFLIIGYIGYLVAVKKKDDILAIFSFIPWPSRASSPRGSAPPERGGDSPKLLDTSAIIDGRILDIYRCGFLEGQLVVPRFVLEELRQIADSEDSAKRNRGRRGLDILRDMQEEQGVVEITNQDPQGRGDVDGRLISLAQKLSAKIITNDYNLNKVAQLEGLEVLNINDLANVLKPPVLPGEDFNIGILKEGKEPGQGVGYLDDGTMVVVEGGRKHIGEDLEVSVTSVLQTAAGRMIFARPHDERRSNRERTGTGSL